MLLVDNVLERNGTLSQILAGVLIALVSGLVGRYFAKRDRARKTFDCRVLSDVAILSHRPEDSELKVVYLEDELDNPRVVRVWFANTGTEVVRATEVLEQCALTVDNGWLVSVTMVDQSAQNLATFEASAVDANSGKVTLTLATLNPGDHFTLQMIVDSTERAQFTFAGRIEGETRPPEILVGQPEEQRFLGMTLRSEIGLGAVCLVLAVAMLFIVPVRFLPFAVSPFLVFGCFFLLGAWGDSVQRRVRSENGVMWLE